MKNCISKLILLVIILATSSFLKAQETKKAVSDTTKTAKKEESNRNVMLNAANNTGPRELNVGLPASVGGTTILENGLPVVYYFWPELPNRTWRGSVSLGKVGLMGLQESSVVMGEFGYAVNSFTRLGGDKHSISANISGNHFGWINGDVNLSGPICKKNKLYYTAGIYQNYDPGSYNLKFATYMDKTQIYRVGITKRFKNGEVSLLYKYAESLSLPNYAVFRYEKGGSVKELDNFRIGRDSYLPRDGKMHMLDALTGKYYDIDLSKASDVGTSSHTIDLMGKNKLKNNWLFNYILRYRHSKASALAFVPLQIREDLKGFTYEDGTAYNGPVQTAFFSHSRSTPLTTFQSRFDISKKTNSHNWKIGLLGSYFDEDRFAFNRAVFYQEVAAAPKRLWQAGLTDQYGVSKYNNAVPYHAGHEIKISTFFSDEWNVCPWLDLNYGVGARYQKMKGDFSKKREEDHAIGGVVIKETTPFNHNWYHVNAAVNAVFKLTKEFGLTANAIYTEKHGALEDYASSMELPAYKKSRSPYFAAGAFYNHPVINIVTSASFVSRSNNQARLNLSKNTPGGLIADLIPVRYTIQTIGWTTDVIVKPFKGFNFHALVTIQNPVYKDYEFTFDNEKYSYNDKNVVQISKFLLELDPSYSFNKWRVWASVRYFSKQYANYTNALYFKGWWETFGGVQYNMNKNIGFGLTVINPLNQSGAKGTINGAELINNADEYFKNRSNIMSSSFIRPFTVEGSIRVKF